MKEEKGITLMALIITIIIMLILVSATISIIMEGSLLNKAKYAKEGTRGSSVEEQVQMWKAETAMGGGKTAEQKIKELYDQQLITDKDIEELDFIDGDIKGDFKYNGKSLTIGDKKIDFNLEKNLPNAFGNQFNNDNTGTVKIGDYVNYTPTLVTLSNNSKIIQDLSEYSGNTSNSYNKVDSQYPITQDTNLRWRVYDKLPTGEIRLISAYPTTSKISLGYADGYNNGVTLLDNFCNELYNNQSVALYATNIKSEDIIDKLTWDYTEAYKYGEEIDYGYSSSNSYYPSIFYNEQWQKVNDSTHGNVKESEALPYTKEGVKNASSIKPTNTHWNRSVDNQNQYFINDTYHELITYNGQNNNAYWISSRAVATFNSSMYSSLGMRIVNDEDIGISASYMFYTNNDGNIARYFARPIVTLKPSVSIEGGDGITGWIIE